MAINWKRTSLTLTFACAFLAGTAVAVVAQDTITSQRDTDPATMADLTDEQVAELGGEDAAAGALAATAAVDGTFTSNRGVYTARNSQCVLFDTRNTSKPTGDSVTTFSLTDPTSQGGEAGCTVPSSALSVHINLIALNPDANGNLKVWPASVAEPNGGIVNYSPQNPPLNNSNAFIVGYDAAGWDVRVNGGSADVRGVLIGNFFDGGDTFAAASHDHQVVQAAGGVVEITSTTAQVVRGVNATYADECSAIFTESHKALVTYSGFAREGTTGAEGNSTRLDIELWVDGSQVDGTEVAFPNGVIEYEDAFSKTFLVNVSPGTNHSFQVRAHREDGASTTGFVDADIVVEHRGWTCNLFVFPLDDE